MLLCFGNEGEFLIYVFGGVWSIFIGSWVIIGEVESVVFSMDFDLEVFSYNFIYGSFVLLVF